MIFYKLPLHTSPVPVNPSLQVHIKLSILFLHCALAEHRLNKHSLKSTQGFILKKRLNKFKTLLKTFRKLI